jgi:hypothetical protein
MYVEENAMTHQALITQQEHPLILIIRLYVRMEFSNESVLIVLDHQNIN